jgi:hypothetical protein
MIRCADAARKQNSQQALEFDLQAQEELAAARAFRLAQQPLPNADDELEQGLRRALRRISTAGLCTDVLATPPAYPTCLTIFIRVGLALVRGARRGRRSMIAHCT